MPNRSLPPPDLLLSHATPPPVASARSLVAKGNATKPAARYHGTVQVDKLSAWLTDVADVYIGLAGTLKAFDAFARRFAETAADDAETRSTIFGEAEAALASVSTVDVDQIAKATVYIKIMKKVIANGSSYIADEIGRIQK